MPILEFPGRGLDSQYLFAVMVYPNDDLAQEELLSVGCAHHFSTGLTDGSTVSIPAEMLKTLSGSDSYATVLVKAARIAATVGIAGNILVNLARLKLRHSKS